MFSLSIPKKPIPLLQLPLIQNFKSKQKGPISSHSCLIDIDMQDSVPKSNQKLAGDDLLLYLLGPSLIPHPASPGLSRWIEVDLLHTSRVFRLP